MSTAQTLFSRIGENLRRSVWIIGIFFVVVFLQAKSFAGDVRAPVSKSLSIYGYGLFDFCITNEDKERSIYNAPMECRKGGSFAQALLAPFLEFRPFEKARILTEVEIKYAPEIETFGEIEAKTGGIDGKVEYPGPSSVKVEEVEKVEYKTKGADKVKFEGFGEIDFAYVFFEYEFSEFLKVRTGRYLNPFGLLLERRDASPSYVFLFLPQIYRRHNFGGVYKSEFIPLYNVGIQLRGEGKYFRYAVQVANGRGSVANVIDANTDKALGVHASLRMPEGRFFGSLLGFDFYTDENFEKKDTRQNTFAGHLNLAVGDILGGKITLSGEFAFTQIKKSESVPKDISAMGGYGLLSYQIIAGEVTISPYVVWDFIDPDTSSKGDSVSILYGGVAIDPVYELRIKIEVHNQMPEKGKNAQIIGFGISYYF